jgi:hypothetical protein
MGNTAASNAHQTPDICILITKAFTHLGVADTNCCFTLVDVGALGRENDSSGYSNSSFGKAFISGNLNVPAMRNIPGTSIRIPLYFVEDEAFPLKPNLTRPFPRRELDFAKTIFNC